MPPSDQMTSSPMCSRLGRPSRRVFLAGVGASAIPVSTSWARVAKRLGPAKIGWIVLRESIYREPYSQAFASRLNELGFIEGSTLLFDRQDAGDSLARMPEIVRRAVENRPDVIFAGGGEAAFVALKNANMGIPTVFISVDFEPVQAGYIERISRPEGSITGVSGYQSQLPAKRLELLKMLLPKAKKIAVLSNPDTGRQLTVAQNAVDTLGIQLEVFEIKSPSLNFEAAFVNAIRARADAMLVLGSSLFVSARQKIPQLAMVHRLPAIFHQAQWAEAGGLISYGYNFASMWRTGADMVSKILSGASVSEIPMEFPTAYELAINMTTAKFLGIEVPYELKLRADRLIS